MMTDIYNTLDLNDHSSSVLVRFGQKLRHTAPRADPGNSSTTMGGGRVVYSMVGGDC